MKYSYLLVFVLAAARVHAQQVPPAGGAPVLAGLSASDFARSRVVNEAHKVIFYVVGNEKTTEKPEGPSPRVEIAWRDSLSGVVKEFSSTGKLRHVIPFAHIALGIKHGVETTWGEEGQMLTSQEFYGGKQQGEFYAYFPDGKVERHIHFVQNRMEGIECFGRDGKAKNCTVQEALPEYPGGWVSFAADLERGIIYPPADLQDGRGGKLTLVIQVDNAGIIQAAHIRNSPSETLRGAVLTGLAGMKKFRHPGMQENRAIPVQILLSVDMEVKKSGKGAARVSNFPIGIFPPYSWQK